MGNADGTRVAAWVTSLFKGWRKERLISDGSDMLDAARVVLEEFGELTISPIGRVIDFARLALQLDPSEGDGGEVRQSYINAAGVAEFYPLGGVWLQ